VKLRSNQAATAGWNKEVELTGQRQCSKQRYGYGPARNQPLGLS